MGSSMVERSAVNRLVVGSNPAPSTKNRKGGRVWFIAAVLKTVVPKGTVGSNPTPSAKKQEGWQSGLLHPITNRTAGKPAQEFESLTFRHNNRKGQWKTKK